MIVWRKGLGFIKKFHNYMEEVFYFNKFYDHDSKGRGFLKKV